ncbi:hypothetical protein BSKO_11076 [Bryopsis sp. KO-2023]|nr:hypothetical protein BSKO_11076 [Bryopsis sp. KO-2023]
MATVVQCVTQMDACSSLYFSLPACHQNCIPTRQFTIDRMFPSMMSAVLRFALLATFTASPDYDHDFFKVSQGYLEASGGAAGNLKCGNWLSLEAARTECRSNSDCDGFSWGSWGTGLGGCLKKNRNGGYKTNAEYSGHHKTPRGDAAPSGHCYSPTEHLLSSGKRTRQSSTIYGGVSSRAVDGDVNPNYSGNSCTHTKRCKGPWWAVDLGRSYLVTRVVITNRADCCWQRLSNFSIKVGNKQRYLSNLACVTGGKQGRGETKSWACNQEGRIVAIQLMGIGFLTLCEVQVWGLAPVTHAGAEVPPGGRILREQMLEHGGVFGLVEREEAPDQT